MTVERLGDWKAGAVFGSNRRYRYLLWRALRETEEESERAGTCLFYLCNPSKAGHDVNDRTLVKCMEFGRHWGMGRVELVNPAAYIATYPKDLRKAWSQQIDLVGPENREFVERAWKRAGCVVLAWGDVGRKNLPKHPREYLPPSVVGSLAYCIGRTKAGDPRHPLMLGYEEPLERYDWK